MGGLLSRMTNSSASSVQGDDLDVESAYSADVISLLRSDRSQGTEFVSSTDRLVHPLAWEAIQQYFPEGEFNDQQNRVAANYLVHQICHFYGDIREINVFSLCSGGGRSEAYFLARLRDEGIRVNHFYTFDNLFTEPQFRFTSALGRFDLADRTMAFSSARDCRDHLAQEKLNNNLPPINVTLSVHQQFAFFGEHAVEQIQELNGMLVEIEDAKPLAYDEMPFFSFYCDRDWHPAWPDSARLLSQQHGVYVENRNLVDGSLRNATMARAASAVL
jgi:hypothetical protein